MANSTLVFVDAGFLSELSKHFGEGKHLKFDYLKFFKFLAEKRKLNLKKVFYYTAPPFQSNTHNKKEVLRKKGYDSFINKIKKDLLIQIREGRVQKLMSVYGEEFNQKGVDTLMTLDLVLVKDKFPEIDELILITSDTDFCPVIKEIKRFGIKTILYTYIERKRDLLVLCMILLLGSLVSAIPQTFSVHGKLENNAGSPLEGTYNMSFNIYTTYTGGSASWTLSNQDVTTDSNGIYNIVLTNVNLDFGSQYYLGVTVGNDSEMSPRINLTSSPYAFEAQNVSVSGVRFNSNVDFGTNYNFTFDGGTLFVDGSNGYVGIGTTSPQAILHTQTTGTGNKTGLIVGRNTANTNDISSIVFNSADLGDQGAIDSIILSGSTADLAFRTRTASALTEKVRITTTGYVGIGTTTPHSKLEVKDTAPFITINGTGANSEPGLKIQNDARGWQFYVAGGDADKLYIRDTTVPATRMVIDDSGYVGIGTTTPQQKLDVVGNINSTGFINATTDLCIQGGACLSSVSASAGGWTKTGTQVALTTATDNVSIGSTDFYMDRVMQCD